MKNTMINPKNRLFIFLLSSLPCFLGAQSMTLLRDIHLAPMSSSPNGLRTANGMVYFNAEDGIHGRELWKSDGTEAGTEMVKDIASGDEDSSPDNFCNVNGTVFFTAFTLQHGVELWKTDGTAGGTSLVADLLPGNLGSAPSNLVSCNGKLFFTANVSEGLAEDIRLFVTDGSPGGMVEIVSPDPINLFSPRNLLAGGNTLYFTATHGIDGEELWQTNGTVAGTKMVNNLNPGGFLGSHPKNLCYDGLNIYFSANDGSVNGRQIWRYNLNLKTMTRLTSLSLQSGNTFGELLWHPNNVVFFTAASVAPGPGYELYRINSQAPNGATKIAGASMVGNLQVLGLKLCFTQALAAGPKLSYVLTNSVNPVTLKTFALIPNNDYPMPAGLVVTNNKLFFTAVTETQGRELWKSDGTAAGTVIVADHTPGPKGSDISNLCRYASKLVFGCKGLEGNELRSTDGSSITLIRNIAQGNSDPSGFVKMDNTTYFSADDGWYGRELWKTDGTTEGTLLMTDVYTGAKGSSPSNFLVVNASNGAKTLFFVAFNEGTGRELYKLENTPNAVPVRISDIVPGIETSNIGNLTNVNGTLYFTATNNVFGLGDRIYRVNAARTGVETIGGTMISAGNLVAKGNILFFTQLSLAGVPMLCKLVAGATTTIKTFDQAADVINTEPRYLTVVGNYLYFSAADAIRGRELWRTNAAATSALPISDIRPGFNGSNIGHLTNFNGVLHFTAMTDDVALGPLLYKTNAALTGVEQIPGPITGAFDLNVAGNRMFFFQATPGLPFVKLCALENNQVSPLKTFGPTLGELPVAKNGMTVAGNNVYFGAFTAENGLEIWKSNGTEAGTVLLGDIRPGAVGSNLLEMRLAGPDIYLSAHNLAYGQEPWKIASANALGNEGEERNDSATLSSSSDLKISPNPAIDKVQVTLPENNLEGALSVVTFSGQILHSVQVQAAERSFQMNLQDLPKGLYLFCFTQHDGKVWTQKVIVQ